MTSSTSTSPQQTALNAAIALASAKTKSEPVEVFRSSYQPLPTIVSKINMNFDIHDGKTTVTSELTLESNPKLDDTGEKATEGGGDLVLDGDETCVKLFSVTLNDRELVETVDYEFAPQKLIIKQETLAKERSSSSDGGALILKTVVEVVPEENTQLSGLYKSGPMYCTQCEALGFRRITYYP